MARRTMLDNFRGIGYGIMPDWVPRWRMGSPDPDSPAVMAGAMSVLQPPGAAPQMMGAPGLREWKDMWGVPYVNNEETGYAGLPKPGDFIMPDVTKWDQVIKHPQDINEAVANADWETLAAEATKNIDRSDKGVVSGVGFMPFQQLMGFMGFTEGLCAIIEEPDAVIELLNYIADYYVPVTEKVVDYFKPDFLYLLDDTASKYSTFFSMDSYRKVFKPIYVKLTEYGVQRGIPVILHNCGRCEDQIDEFLDFGVRYWDPAQTDNDLLGIKEKYQGKLGICGAFDFVPEQGSEITEEVVRQKVRDTLNKYAQGGGYAFGGNILGRVDNAELVTEANGWIADEYRKISPDFYK
ncbi:MAG: veratrol--corrinoid protein metyltransferase [Eubacteriaceae bacterium]|nr:veratrol--corrinoid protein metyltransferase [Eubacteriaceae bacterium]